MIERGLAKDAVNIAGVAMLAYWVIGTKSGRICFILLLLIGAFRTHFYPETDYGDDPTSAFAQCKADARTTWGAEMAHAKLIACYEKYSN